MNDKLLTIRQVMDIIPMGKTTVQAIVKSLPHVKLKRKMMVYESYVNAWIRDHTRYPSEAVKRQETRRRRTLPDDSLMLDENGMIPTRRKLERMMKQK